MSDLQSPMSHIKYDLSYGGSLGEFSLQMSPALILFTGGRVPGLQIVI